MLDSFSFQFSKDLVPLSFHLHCSHEKSSAILIWVPLCTMYLFSSGYFLNCLFTAGIEKSDYDVPFLVSFWLPVF